MPSSATSDTRPHHPSSRGGDSDVPLKRITMPVVAVLAVAGAVAGGAIAFAKIGSAAETATCTGYRNERRVDAHDLRLNALEAEQARADERWDRIQADLTAIKDALKAGN